MNATPPIMAPDRPAPTGALCDWCDPRPWTKNGGTLAVVEVHASPYDHDGLRLMCRKHYRPVVAGREETR